jgi:hypothetical protein
LNTTSSQDTGRATCLLEVAVAYAKRGLKVFPVHSTDSASACSCGKLDCGSPGKHPRTNHGLNDASCDPEQIRDWWARWPDANIAMNCGASDRIVIDIDDKDGRPGPASWSAVEQELGDHFGDTARVATPSGGCHLHYLVDGRHVGSGNDRFGFGVDVKAEGGYVLLPPSAIGGVRYAWVEGQGFEHTKPIPESLATRLESATAQTNDRGRSGRPQEARITKGERDDTLFRDACALRKRGFSDGAIEAALLERNAEQCDPPLPESQVRAKVASSARYDPPSQACDESVGEVPCDRNGWLVSDGAHLLSLAHLSRNDVGLLPWTNFDPRVVGVTVDDEGRRCYLTELVRIDGATSRVLLDASALGNLQKLSVVLAAYGCSIVPAPREVHGRHEAARLLRFLDAQDAATYKTAEALGWHDGVGFLTHEGVLTAGGFSQHLDVVPHPMLANRAPYRYGLGNEGQAVAVLKALLTMHDETVCSVVGSWSVACLLANELRRYTKHFPDLGLEGSSGTGKTSGPFGDQLQLITGNAEGPCELTAASLRDRMGAHRNAPVWLDDVSNTAAIYDLLRQATSGGSRLKMAADNTHMAKTALVAPVMISGEHLGPIHAEKAMMDRFLLVELPSPAGLSPLRDGRSRFDALMDLRTAHKNDFTVLAGNVVQLVLQRAHYVDQFREQRDDRVAREADKMAVLRVGALVLSDLTGDPSHFRRVEDWIAAQQRVGDENVLTFAMIPRALRAKNLPASALDGPPAFHDRQTGIVWFSEALLSDWWNEQRNLSDRERRLGSAESIRLQRKALGTDGKGVSKATKDSPANGKRHRLTARYHALSVELSAQVIERCGLSDGDSDEG